MQSIMARKALYAGDANSNGGISGWSFTGGVRKEPCEGTRQRPGECKKAK